MAPERAAIERQLDAIFASDEFSSAPKMRALLRYLVDATLAGDADRLKGYAIGVDVFERGAAFDPATDPIVRVQAGRLRKLLETYYRTAGQDDPIRIEIPKGGYAVALTTGQAEPAADGDGVAAAQAPSALPIEAQSETLGRWTHGSRAQLALAIAACALAALAFLAIRSFSDRGTPVPPAPIASGAPAAMDAITLAVLPFTNMSNDASKAGFADGLTDALTTALARVKTISLASRTSAFQYREATDLRLVGRELGVRYILEGALQHDGERMRINVQLIDAATGAHLWAQDYDRPAKDELALQSELVTTLAAEIRPQLFSAAKRAMAAYPAQSATAWQLYMQSTWMPGEARNDLAWEKERVALATRALEIDPNLGQAHSVLADKLAFLANVDPPSDTEAARRHAFEHARRAIELAPGDPDAMFNVSIHHWHAGRTLESLDATRRTLELDPHHVLARFLVKGIPYTCAEVPQAVIDDLATFDAAISPDNPVRWVTLYWISRVYLNNNDLERAHDAARRADQVFRSPDSFYQLAAILVQLGEPEAAVAQINQQRQNWPNLDPRHYAEVTIARRCGGAPKAAFLRRIYSDLADAVEAARGG
ncbi:hypothetical protein [Hyphomicrobium sp.]|uniref:hypothetical protein n=1 Tax=Hyphomicrobium sp. TaxID=82 RepID=UPI0025C62EB0|nr:hypothetical protein [Hyphomicrobium sp.]MCC7252614.1 hypothetical protein [Hyphomicrobium sp.]